MAVSEDAAAIVAAINTLDSNLSSNLVNLQTEFNNIHFDLQDMKTSIDTVGNQVAAVGVYLENTNQNFNDVTTNIASVTVALTDFLNAELQNVVIKLDTLATAVSDVGNHVSLLDNNIVNQLQQQVTDAVEQSIRQVQYAIDRLKG